MKKISYSKYKTGTNYNIISNLHIKNLSNDIVSTNKQLVDDVLLSFIILNAKT